MRLSHHLGYSCLAALVALALPSGQAHAQACVDFAGLNHCTTGSARLSVTEEGLKVQSGTTSGQDGVVVAVDGATSWTAGTRMERSGLAVEKTVLTAAAEGAPVSTATVQTQGLRSSYSATFTGSGQGSTYSAMVYARGVFQGGMTHVRNGTIGATNPGGPITTGSGPAPTCTIFPYAECMQECYRHNWQPCTYCSNPCGSSFDNLVSVPGVLDGTCQWTFALHDRNVQLADGRIVQGDTLILREEVPAAGSYPYLSFDQIVIQSTAKSTTVSNESTNSGK
jgi:hypothetical protein